MKNLKTILIIGAVLAVIGGAIGAYLFFKPVAKTENISPSHNISSDIFAREFQEENTTANEKYSNNVVQITGTVSSIENDASGNVNVIMNADSSIIQFSFSGDEANTDAKKIKESDKVTIKGKYTGFLEDDLFGGLIIKLNECVLVEAPVVAPADI